MASILSRPQCVKTDLRTQNVWHNSCSYEPRIWYPPTEADMENRGWWLKCLSFVINIYIIISKNIRYLLWNQGLWRSLNITYPIFLIPCIRCTNYLCDSCDLTDVNRHFIPSLLRMVQNVDLLWRHRYKSWTPAIVTSQWPIVPAWLLWTLS